MLAIIFMPLLVVVAPMVSAGPLALPASPTPDLGLVTSTGTDGQAEVVVTITNPATATTTIAPSSPENDAPRRTQQPELRDAPQPPPQAQQRDAGFATSPATTTTTNSATEEHTRVGDHAAAAAAKTTPRPSDDPEADSELAREGYSQTTYYACQTYAVSTHCGWHVPVVHVGGARRVVPGGAPGFVAAGAVMACGMFVNAVLGF